MILLQPHILPGPLKDQHQSSRSSRSQIWLLMNLQIVSHVPTHNSICFPGNIAIGPFENTLRGRDSPNVDRRILHKAEVGMTDNTHSIIIHFPGNAPHTPLCLTPSLLVFYILIQNMHTEVMLLKLRHQRERERGLPSVTFGQSKSCVQCKDALKVCGAHKDDGHKTTLYFIVM